MSKPAIKTDNSFLSEKVMLRLEILKKIRKKTIKILDAFNGQGIIWKVVSEKTKKNILIIPIEIKDKPGIYLKCDNIKFIKGMDLSNFDIIDLDAYGSPYKQLSELFKKDYKGFVICTYNQRIVGNLHKKMLIELGFTNEMIKKIPTLFTKNPIGKMKDYLSIHNVKKITGYFLKRTNYFYFFVG